MKSSSQNGLSVKQKTKMIDKNKTKLVSLAKKVFSKIFLFPKGNYQYYFD